MTSGVPAAAEAARSRPLPAGPTAAELWARSRAASDLGRWTTGLRLAQRALRRLDAEEGARAAGSGTVGIGTVGIGTVGNGTVGSDTVGPARPSPEAAALRARILISLAYNHSESGEIDRAAELLERAAQADPASMPVVRIARSMLHARTGRAGEALADLDRAVDDLRDGRGSGDLEDLAGALINRGMLQMLAGRLGAARVDTEAAGGLGGQLGDPDISFMAAHNLGYVRFLGGDLPGALEAMASAVAQRPEAAEGVPALDRGRVLLSAGLVAEARESVEHAIDFFRRHRATADLVDALGLRAEIALFGGDAVGARVNARRAARLALARGNQRAALVCELLNVRAAAIQRPPTAARRRSRMDAGRAGELAASLLAAGMPDDARAARLLEAEALLDAGDPAAAAEAARAADQPGPPPALSTRLLTRLVNGRLKLADGRLREGLSEVRRGLDDLADFQARFGSQDMQSAAAVHGRALARLGLRTAVQTRSPAAILQWLERSRGASTRLPAVRPPEDEALAEALGSLRSAVEQARQAALRGERTPALDRHIADLRRRVRTRSWNAEGSGAANRPLSLAGVQRRLALGSGAGSRTRPGTGSNTASGTGSGTALGSDAGTASVVAPFLGRGHMHALVITATSARYVPLGRNIGLEACLHRIEADLDLLADPRVTAPLRAVARASLQTQLARLARAIADPLLPLVGTGPVMIAAAGLAALVPWSLLPGLTGRPVSVTASVTAALASWDRPSSAHRGGVLAVAGPEVPNAPDEVDRVAGLHRAATALVGPAAAGGAVLAQLPGDGLMHVAAHGHHAADNPLFSSVLLADGPLYAYDLASSGVLPQQVVLSSCDVGRVVDRPGGEPLGLVAALLRSGVRTVVAGTSRVSDAVAATVMPTYHERLVAGDGPAAALAFAVQQVPDEPTPFTVFGAGH